MHARANGFRHAPLQPMHARERGILGRTDRGSDVGFQCPQGAQTRACERDGRGLPMRTKSSTWVRTFCDLSRGGHVRFQAGNDVRLQLGRVFRLPQPVVLRQPPQRLQNVIEATYKCMSASNNTEQRKQPGKDKTAPEKEDTKVQVVQARRRRRDTSHPRKRSSNSWTTRGTFTHTSRAAILHMWRAGRAVCVASWRTSTSQSGRPSSDASAATDRAYAPFCALSTIPLTNLTVDSDGVYGGM